MLDNVLAVSGSCVDPVDEMRARYSHPFHPLFPSLSCFCNSTGTALAPFCRWSRIRGVQSTWPPTTNACARIFGRRRSISAVPDWRCNRTRASVGNAGGNARPSLTNATLAASRLLHLGFVLNQLLVVRPAPSHSIFEIVKPAGVADQTN